MRISSAAPVHAAAEASPQRVPPPLGHSTQTSQDSLHLSASSESDCDISSASSEADDAVVEVVVPLRRKLTSAAAPAAARTSRPVSTFVSKADAERALPPLRRDAAAVAANTTARAKRRQLISMRCAGDAVRVH